MSRILRVAIVGGGIGGLSAALAMHRHGINVTVHERASAIGEIGAGITLSPNAIKAYRALGIEGRIADIGFESDYQTVREWDTGKVISQVDRKGTYQKAYGAPYYSMHRADLVDVLARSLPEGTVHLNARCVGAKTTNLGSAVARFADGGEVEADLVVGADGIHSAVRESIFGKQAPRFTGTVCWRGLVPYDALPANRVTKDWNLYMGPQRHLIHYMVRRGDLVNFVAHVETDSWTGESWTQECDRAEVLKTFAGWHAPLLDMIAAAESCFKWALYDRDPLQKWSVGRVTLLGDSAHAMPPFIGQGAGMAIEDGYVLAAMIAQTPGDIAAALARYERLRVPRASRAVYEARARGEQMHLTSRWAQIKRNVFMTLKRRLGGDKTGVQLGDFYSYDVATEAAAMRP